MNTYRCSDGERVKQSVVDYRTSKAKEQVLQNQLYEYGYNFCEECGHNGSKFPLDCSHDYSVGQAKKDGKTEQAWNIKNIVIRCRDCHQKHDKLDLQWS